MMLTLAAGILTPLAWLCGVAEFRRATGRGWREAAILTCALIYTTVFVVSEVLSAFNAFHCAPIAAFWWSVSAVVLARGMAKSRRPRLEIVRLHIAQVLAGLPRWCKHALVFAGALLLLKLIEGIILPPTTMDALTYHLPRLLHWFEHGNLSFFDTAILRQNYISPGFSLLLAHVDAFSGGDYYYHAIQWMAAVLLGVSATLLAQAYGAGLAGQAVTGVLVLTSPVTVAQSTTAYCDILAAWPLVAFSYFFTQALRSSRAAWDIFGSGLIGGLAFLSKTQNLLFIPILAAGIAGWEFRQADGAGRRRLVRLSAGAACLAVLFLLPHVLRNLHAYGRPMGCPETDTLYRYPLSFGSWLYTLTCRVSDILALPLPPVNAWVGGVIHRLFPHFAGNPAYHFPGNLFVRSSGSLTSGTSGTWFLTCVICGIGVIRAATGRGYRLLVLPLSAFLCFALFNACFAWMPWDNRFFIGLLAIATAAAVVTFDVGCSNGKALRAAVGSCCLAALPAVLLNLTLYVPGFVYRKSANAEKGLGWREVSTSFRNGTLCQKIMHPPAGIDPELERGYHYLLTSRDRLRWGEGRLTQTFMYPAYSEAVARLGVAVAQEGCDRRVVLFPYVKQAQFPLDWEYQYWQLANGTGISFVSADAESAARMSASGRPVLAVCPVGGTPPNTFLSGQDQTCVYTNALMAIYRCGGRSDQHERGYDRKSDMR